MSHIPSQVARANTRIPIDDEARHPTRHRPGSPEKIALLAARRRLRLPLHLSADLPLLLVPDALGGLAPPPRAANGTPAVANGRQRSPRERVKDMLARDQESARKRTSRKRKAVKA